MWCTGGKGAATAALVGMSRRFFARSVVLVSPAVVNRPHGPLEASRCHDPWRPAAGSCGLHDLAALMTGFEPERRKNRGSLRIMPPSVGCRRR